MTDETPLHSIVADGLTAHEAGNFGEALQLFTKAAEQGDAEAQFYLGLMHYNGDGLPQDHKHAVHWWEKSAKQENAEAQSNLGLMYHNGLGVPQDYKQAATWWKKAAQQGLAHAQHDLAVMYHNGIGVPQDDKQAYIWVSLAVHNGYSEGQAVKDAAAELLNPQDLLEAQNTMQRCLDSGYKDC